MGGLALQTRVKAQSRTWWWSVQLPVTPTGKLEVDGNALPSVHDTSLQARARTHLALACDGVSETGRDGSSCREDDFAVWRDSHAAASRRGVGCDSGRVDS